MKVCDTIHIKTNFDDDTGFAWCLVPSICPK